MYYCDTAHDYHKLRIPTCNTRISRITTVLIKTLDLSDIMMSLPVYSY